jgi:hypothetical protein
VKKTRRGSGEGGAPTRCGRRPKLPQPKFDCWKCFKQNNRGSAPRHVSSHNFERRRGPDSCFLSSHSHRNSPYHFLCQFAQCWTRYAIVIKTADLPSCHASISFGHRSLPSSCLHGQGILMAVTVPKYQTVKTCTRSETTAPQSKTLRPHWYPEPRSRSDRSCSEIVQPSRYQLNHPVILLSC